MVKRLIVLVLAIIPLAAWGLYSPMRVLAPELNGMTCINETLCIDDVRKTNEAQKLYHESSRVVAKTLGPFNDEPRAIFCMTEQCYKSFGFKAPSVAHTVGVSGVVISPRGWNINKIVHEFTHHIQAERLGVVQMLFKPEWLIEGMAYCISNDNMNDVPQRYVEAKNHFVKWQLENGNKNLWEAARNL